MAKGDIRIIDVGGRTNVPVRTFPTRAGETAINAGEPVIIGNTAAVLQPYVIALVDNKPVINGNDYFVGIAANAGSHSATADGYVDVYLEGPSIVYAAKAKSATTFNTQKLVDSQTFYRIVFDLTSSSYTADVAADNATRGLIIVGGEFNNYVVYFTSCDSGSWDR